MDEHDPIGEIPPWLVKRKKNEKCISTKYTEDQCIELRIIIDLYTSICFQYDHAKNEKNSLLFFLLTRDKCSEFFRLGYYSITDFRYWQSLLDSSSLLYNALQTIMGHLCAAQLAAKERLGLQGHTYEPSTMVLEEIKSWVMKISQLKILGMPLRDELNARKLFFSEASSHPALFKELPEFAEAVYKCGMVVESEMLPCLNAVLTQYFVQKPFSSFKESMRDSLESLFRFMFHIFRDTEYVVSRCNLADLQDPILRMTIPMGRECDATVSGRTLLKLVASPVMREIFQGNYGDAVGYKKLCESSFMSEEGADPFPKEWSNGSGKNIIAIPFGILPVFRDDIKLMRRFIRLHELTQRMAVFYIIFQDFSELKHDCRYVLKELREAIQHYKLLYAEWTKCIHDLYEKAGSYLVKIKYSKSVKEIEYWQRHFSEVRNSYDGLMKNLSVTCAAVYELERMYAEIEPIPPLNQAKVSLGKFFELIGHFTEKFKSYPSQGESRDLLLSPSTPQRAYNAPGSSATTLKK